MTGKVLRSSSKVLLQLLLTSWFFDRGYVFYEVFKGRVFFLLRGIIFFGPASFFVSEKLSDFSSEVRTGLQGLTFGEELEEVL